MTTTDPKGPRSRAGLALLAIFLADCALVIGVALWLLMPSEAQAQSPQPTPYPSMRLLAPPATERVLMEVTGPEGETETAEVVVTWTEGAEDGLRDWAAVLPDEDGEPREQMWGTLDQGLLVRRTRVVSDDQHLTIENTYDRERLRQFLPLEPGAVLTLPVASRIEARVPPTAEPMTHNRASLIRLEVDAITPIDPALHTLEGGERMTVVRVVRTLPGDESRQISLIEPLGQQPVWTEETIRLPNGSGTLVRRSRTLSWTVPP